MRMRAFPLYLLLAAAGCASLPALEPGPEPIKEPSAALSPARRVWEQGQIAMRRGQPDVAIACYKQSLELDPRFYQAHLSLAAAHLEIGDDESACPPLGRYVEACPDQVAVRGHFAELLYRLKHKREAREQFDRFIALAQEQGGPAAKNLLHSHSRLMEIAEQEQDAYAEHLHRGIGLLLLARAHAELSEESNDPTSESLLCKAAGELTLAREEEPNEARAGWYLYQVWSALDQRALAARWLRDVQDAAPFHYLTPSERCSLQLAASHSSLEMVRR
jgi:tetratricopeptide (TPR) repeat protein